MIANFHINYGTKAGEHVAIQFKKNGGEETIICQTYDDANWHGVVQIEESDILEYRYMIQTLIGLVVEHGGFRPLTIPQGVTQVFYQDFWRGDYQMQRAFFSSAFKDIIFKRPQYPTAKTLQISHFSAKNRIIFQLYAAAISQQYCFGIVGNTPALGNWVKPLIMSDQYFPLWHAEIEVDDAAIDIEYKFVIYDLAENKIVEWEGGENRVCSFRFPSPQANAVVKTDEIFRYTSQMWRGAGVAIPVFSLKSEDGLGIGEFTDLKLLTDWAAKTGLKLIQILPVNDTIATKTWRDSYPYAAISVFALHPLYVNIQAIAKLKDKNAQMRLENAITALNALETVDFERVLNYKFEFFKLLFEQEKNNFYKNKEVQQFIEKNADWLKPYAAFCHLRDLNDTTNFYTWKKYATFSQQIISELCTPQYADFDALALYYFIQYYAHQQLLNATIYARKNGVVLKGDLPIGIYRYSCDAWVAPHLYNMNGQAGAPPDAYAVAGQNWGFPTYNWDVMARDNFAWWQQRMTKLSEYFDALRIDHILGFFRIWEIPLTQVEGTLGLFNPRLPYKRQELDRLGLSGNLDRYTKPYIRGHFLSEVFDEEVGYVCHTFLNEVKFGNFELKEFVDNQQKIKTLFAENEEFKDKKHLEKGLMRLVGEVILIEEPNSENTAFNPRITVHTTYSYKNLSDFEKYLIDRLYDDYFFKRHDEFWKQQALWKLPALIRATNMLICGEDLGMIPNSVPGVMYDLNIIALEIQRMPKGKTTFGDTKNYPYMTVCSPSCHDMSTVRGWWESDAKNAQLFYEENLYQAGIAPSKCTPEIVEAIDRAHFESPSMWAIFPIQDLVGIDAALRRVDANAEQINEPSNPQHYWRFRFHLTLERLVNEHSFNEKIKSMVHDGGRDSN